MKLKFKTDSKHPDFGLVHVGCSLKGEYIIKQANERMYLTADQVIELRNILNDIIKLDTKE